MEGRGSFAPFMKKEMEKITELHESLILKNS